MNLQTARSMLDDIPDVMSNYSVTYCIGAENFEQKIKAPDFRTAEKIISRRVSDATNIVAVFIAKAKLPA